MYLPQFSGIKRKAQRQVVEFGGLNYTQNIRDGELASARGLSDRMWPALTTRVGRVLAGSSGQVSDLFAWDKLVTVEGSSLCYDGQVVGAVEPGKKQFAVVNTKLCIFPDKVYLDLETMQVEELGHRGEIASELAKFQGDTVTIDIKVSDSRISITGQGTVNMRVKPYREDGLKWSAKSGWTLPDMAEEWTQRGGSESGIYIKSVKKGDCLLLRAAPWTCHEFDCDYPREGETWADAYSETGDYFLVVENNSTTDASGENINVTVERRRMSRVPDAFSHLAEGDRVNITGCVKAEENNREALEIKEVGMCSITFALGDGDQFVTATETGTTVVIEKEIPDLDFICESNNRLFGCSSKENTIYASALGDPTNWFTYAGLASDSYAVAVGSPGAFTGCCAYGSSVLFWKENALHKLMGLYPEEYEVISYQFVGVQAGCERSVRNINEVLIYKGRDGVYSYTGGYPQKISGKLGLVDYDGAVAGSDGRNYIISMRRVDTGAWETLCYGVETGLWMGEDSQSAEAFAALDGALYLLADGKLYRREGEDDRPEGENGQETGIPWEAVFVPVNETVHNKKGYSRLLLRLELDQGAWAEVDVSIDSGPWKTVWTARAGDSQSVVIPVRPGRCDRFQARVRGEGRFVLRSMVREFTVGSVM